MNVPSDTQGSGAAQPPSIVVGKVVGLYGVRGGLKVLSYTEPRENILEYAPWYLRRGGEWVAVELADSRAHGAGLVVFLRDCADRDVAAQWVPAEIAVKRAQLPTPPEGEFYWADLVGLPVRTAAGIELGKVSSLFETGANDVLVVTGERERMIPYIPGEVILRVRLVRGEVPGEIVVEWDPDF